VSLYAVTREAGSGWTDGGAFDQVGVQEHAAFMDRLAEEGFVRCAGPLAGTQAGRIRALVIVDAHDDAEVRRRLVDDPWTHDDHLVITSVEPWTLLVGAERLGAGAQP
jgi:uncharacterized protein YciI